jgi:uracil-DNA glycosylase
MNLPAPIQQALTLADASWQAPLQAGLAAMQQAKPHYLSDLIGSAYLPTNDRLFAAFAQPVSRVRYVLVGEGPYPRAQSATGVCFMDGAVDALWASEIDGGLSKAVNRATSLRNFIKMLAVAAGELAQSATTGTAMVELAQRARSDPANWIHTLAQLQHNLSQAGFLLLNASLVFRPEVPPQQDAQSWQPFIAEILQHLASARPQTQAPTLVLWGKIASQVAKLPYFSHFPTAISEHPYNLSFISNHTMQTLFAPLCLLRPLPMLP